MSCHPNTYSNQTQGCRAGGPPSVCVSLETKSAMRDLALSHSQGNRPKMGVFNLGPAALASCLIQEKCRLLTGIGRFAKAHW